MPTGVLLTNLGTPDSPSRGDVRRYLREFLHDPRVIDIPAPLRFLLVEGTILPFRPKTSAAAYEKVWLPEGSPLLVHSRALAEKVARELGDPFRVVLAMRYGRPSIRDGLDELRSSGATRVVVVPLFPQYATSSTASALDQIERNAGGLELAVLESFYEDPDFIAALSEVTRPELDAFKPDHVLMSFHGLPERQLKPLDPTGQHCLSSSTCCDAIVAANERCYRAQSFATARALAGELGLEGSSYSVSFQSRLGRTPWIQPFTDEVLPELARSGVRRLAVTCPSFVADCLETLEEIGIRAREQWNGVGGDELHLVPCVNAHPRFVAAVAGWVRERAQS